MLFLFPSYTFAQELDESFLKSLPEDVASDLLERSNNKEALEETQYRRPSTFIEKPKPTSDRFGAKIFSMMQSSLMPLNEPNFDSNYILDFGDEIEVQLVGKKSSFYKLRVKRDGSVNIEDIGKLFISGLSLDKATQLIKTTVERSFIGVKAFITLTNVRDIQVIIAGNAYNPGSYTLNGNSNIFHALSVSGGPSELGTFRSINLIRNNNIIEAIDLYDTFIYGNSIFKTRLRSGDVVFIKPLQNSISLSGAINRPGTYELKADEDLSQAIFFANGISAVADLSNIKLERILDGRIKNIPIKNISQFNNIKSKNLDRVFIRQIPFRSISINGAVLNPGEYLMNEGDTYFDVIKKAGGYTLNAYPFGTVYETEESLAINKAALDRLYKESLDNILNLTQKTGSEINFVPLIDILKQLKNSEASGRVIINFEEKGLINQVPVQNGDIITVPEKNNQVYIFGEISSDGSTQFKSGETFEYYINKKGGTTLIADKSSIFIIHPNGETDRASANRNLFAKQAKEIKLYPGSIIFIPRKIDTEYSSRLRAQSYAAILSSLGVSLASISVLKD